MNILGIDCGMKINEITHVSPREAFDLCKKGCIIVDVREIYLNSYKTLEVPNILYIPYSRIKKNNVILSKNKYYLFIDSVGLRSKESVIILMNNGFQNIINIAGGVVEWEREHLPIRINIEERLTGSCMCQLRSKGEIK